MVNVGWYDLDGPDASPCKPFTIGNGPDMELVSSNQLNMKISGRALTDGTSQQQRQAKQHACPKDPGHGSGFGTHYVTWALAWPCIFSGGFQYINKCPRPSIPMRHD